MHFFAVDAIQAIDVQSIEQYIAVKFFLDLQLLVGSLAGIMLVALSTRVSETLSHNACEEDRADSMHEQWKTNTCVCLNGCLAQTHQSPELGLANFNFGGSADFSVSTSLAVVHTERSRGDRGSVFSTSWAERILQDFDLFVQYFA